MKKGKGGDLLQTDRSTGGVTLGGVEQWKVEVAADPGCDAFSALAASHRQAGRPLDARRIAEAGLAVHPACVEGRIALGLALMDLGNLDSARRVLSDLLPSPPPEALDPETLQADLVDEGSWPLESPGVKEVGEPTAAGSPVGAPDDLEIDQAFEAAESDPSEMMNVNLVAEYVLEQETGDLAFEQDTRHETLDDLSGTLGTGGGLGASPQVCEPIDDADQARVLVSLEGWLQNIRRPVQ